MSDHHDHAHHDHGHDDHAHHDHGHHDHGHHDHEHGGEHAGPVGTGPAVLDIGGDVGALVARMDPETLGTELFLRPDADPTTTVHTGVWERREAGHVVAVAVFAELPAGGYRVLDRGADTGRRVDVRGGTVANLDLRRQLLSSP
jgi:hypothetical protein